MIYAIKSIVAGFVTVATGLALCAGVGWSISHNWVPADDVWFIRWLDFSTLGVFVFFFAAVFLMLCWVIGYKLLDELGIY